MEIEKYKGMSNAQIALICATEMVKTMIGKGWAFTGEEGKSVRAIVMMFANRFFTFLENADNDREYEGED